MALTTDVTRIYLAAPWFTPIQAQRHDQVLAVLRAWQRRDDRCRSIYNPRDLICPAGADSATRQHFYDSNIEAITTSQILIAVTDDKDLGTIFELGYAAALRQTDQHALTLVGVALTLGHRPFNLMLAVACDVVCKSTDQLASYLLEGQRFSHDGAIE